MSLQVRCPLCGMQVNVERIRPRPTVAVRVTSKGDRGICHTVVDTPSYVLKRISQCLMLLRFYDLPVNSGFSLGLDEETNYSVSEGCFLPLKENKEVV